MRNTALILAVLTGVYFLMKPRDLRNNNPGNLRDTGIQWKGLIGHDAGGYARFDTVTNGARAMLIDLRTNIQNGNDTIAGIISKWAPESDNNPTSAYIDFVASEINRSPTEHLTVNDLVPLADAMTRFESGGQTLTAQQWREAETAMYA